MPNYPNRSTDYSRERDAFRRGPITAGQALPLVWPDDDTIPEHWSEGTGVARRMWDSVKASGQARYYQQSDVATLWFACEEIATYSALVPVKDSHGHFVIDGETGEVAMQRKRQSPEMLRSIFQMLQSLMVTEGERRKARLELTQDDDDTAERQAAAVLQYKRRLGAVKSDETDEKAGA